MKIKLFGKSVEVKKLEHDEIIPKGEDEVWQYNELVGHIINISADRVEVKQINKNMNKTFYLSELTQRGEIL